MKILVGGAGISGILTAYYLVQQGHRVTLLARGPDPRVGRHVDHGAATWNGAGGRFVTALEGHPYTGPAWLWPGMERAFRAPLEEGGWLGQPFSAYNRREQSWLRQRRRAHADTEQSERVLAYYCDQHRRALALWRELIRQAPALFVHTDLHDRGVLRVYAQPEQWRRTTAFYRDKDIPHRVLTPEQVTRRNPVLAPACAAGEVAGALLVEGLTFDVQQLARNLLDTLAQAGVPLHWDTEIRGLERNGRGEVTHLYSSRGTWCADAYALHFGAYAQPGVLQHTPAQHRLGGVAGRWLLCPRPTSWDGPTKLHGPAQRHGRHLLPAYDLSLVPLSHPETGAPCLAIGGGYVFVGEPPYPGKLENALARVDEYHRQILGRYLGKTREAELVPLNRFTCVRSFTPDDLPLHVTVPCASGGVLVVKSGTNTGTTALAPVIAQEVLAAVAPTFAGLGFASLEGFP